MNRRSGSRSPSRDNTIPTLCWYHRRYGARAQKCTRPCSYRQREKLPQRTSTAAHVCATTTDRLFIKDRISKRQFLIDTGSHLCVYPRRLIPRRKERVNYDLYAPNGTTIPTYRWLPLTTQPGTRTAFHVAIRGGRRHTSPNRHRLPLSFRPPSGLQTQPSTWTTFSFYPGLSRNTNGIYGLSSTNFGGMGSSSTRRKESSEHPRSPSSVTKPPPRVPNRWENE
jgi:hypothetical protein